MMKSFGPFCVSAVLSLLISSVHAAPAQLYNKTISISFSVSAPAKGEDGSPLNGSRQVQRTIYISSQGRIFVRSDRRAGRLSDTVEKGPDSTSGMFRFEGNRLIGVNTGFISGAGQLTVTFDPGFQSCNASIVFGRENGKPFKFKGLNGMIFTATGVPSASSPSCSIRDGNPFS